MCVRCLDDTSLHSSGTALAYSEMMPLVAEEEQVHVPHYHWPHSGAADTFDHASYVYTHATRFATQPDAHFGSCVFFFAMMVPYLCSRMCRSIGNYCKHVAARLLLKIEAQARKTVSATTHKFKQTCILECMHVSQATQDDNQA